MAEHTVTETSQPEPKPPKSKRVPVASIHAHFHIYRDAQATQTGPITRAEQIEAMQRFVRWHTRQVEVGEQLLAKLNAAAIGTGADDGEPLF